MQEKNVFNNVARIVIAFLVILCICAVFVYFVEKGRLSKYKRSAAAVSEVEAHSLSRQLNRSLSATYTLASILRQYGDITDFDVIAADIIEHYGGISSLQLAPNAIVSQVFPLEGNEAAIGHDLLNDPNRRTETLRTIESRELTLAGPFELIQGGVAVIGRNPIFRPDESSGKDEFWGFSIVLIKLPALISAIGINRLVELGYHYELSRLNPDNGEREVFANSNNAALNDPIEIRIPVPNGSWTLSVQPQEGWISPAYILFEVLISILISMGFAFFFEQRSRFVKKLSKKNESLTHEVNYRKQAEAEQRHLNLELKKALSEVKTLSGFLPICASCKKIRDDKGYWTQVEQYVRDHSEAEFSHGICPDCLKTLYPDDTET